MSKKDPADWGPVPGQLELDLDGYATGWDKHSGQHGDIFAPELWPDLGGKVIDDSESAAYDEIDQDAFVDYIHGKDKESAA